MPAVPYLPPRREFQVLWMDYLRCMTPFISAAEVHGPESEAHAQLEKAVEAGCTIIDQVGAARWTDGVCMGPTGAQQGPNRGPAG